MKPVTVIGGPPGLGKTTATLEEIRQSGRRAVVVVARHDLAQEAAQHLPGAKIIQPKVRLVAGQIDYSTSLCETPEVIQGFRNANIGSAEKRHCEQCGKGCAYYQQFEDRDCSWILVHEYLALPVELNDPEVIVIDESILPKIVKKLDYAIDDVLTLRDFLRSEEQLGPGQSDAARLIVEVAQVMLNNKRLDGPLLVSMLRKAELDPWALSQLASDQEVVGRWRKHLLDANTGSKDILVPLAKALADQDCHRMPGRLFVRGHRLHIYERQMLRLPDVPIIILDSSADRDLLELAFPGRRIEMLVPVQRSKVRLVQVVSGNYGITSLRKSRRERSSLLATVKEIFQHRLQIHPGKPCGLITFQCLLPEAKKVLKGLPVVYGHFWAERGSNKFVDKEVKTLIVLGTPSPNPDDIHATAAALCWPDRDVDPRGKTEWRPFGMREHQDGQYVDQEVTVRTNIDPLVNALLRQAREDELMQAVGRIRPFHDPEGKLVVVISAMPIPHFPPTVICKLKDVMRIIDEDYVDPAAEDRAQYLQASLDQFVVDYGRAPKTKKEFADFLGVSRETFYQWRKRVRG